LDNLALIPVSYYPDDIQDGCTDKVNVLIECLLTEITEAQSLDEEYRGLIFVERRDSVLALAEVLKHHPRLKDSPFKIGTLLGTSDSSNRNSVVDITRGLARESQDDTLDAFRNGDMNLIISTAVAEEGIDIQACCSVIRWDPPQNMKSWVQSRGRARKKKSTFTLMYAEGSNQPSSMTKWMHQERQMLESIYNQSRKAEIQEDDVVGDDDEDDSLTFEIPWTGFVFMIIIWSIYDIRHDRAKLTLHSAISHLTHFCATIPNSTHADNRPFFERDPPEYPDGWHSIQTPLPLCDGPYGSTVTLPRALPLPRRRFSVKKEFETDTSAHRHSAFIAYRELYKHKLLNDNLLPIANVLDPKLADEVNAMLADVKKREGLANNTIGFDPWLTDDAQSLSWLCSELTLEGLPPLFLFTRSETIPLDFAHGPTVYPPGQAPVRISLRPVSVDHSKIGPAREFTRRIFWGMNASRMDWDNLDFAYLLLPVQSSRNVWDSRRTWLEDEHKANAELYPDRLMVNANRFVKEFGFMEDLTLIQTHVSSRPLKFMGWRYQVLTSDEEEKLKNRCGKLSGDLDVLYPLMIVQPCARTNMLLPSSRHAKTRNGSDIPTEFLIPTSNAIIILLSKEEAEYAFLLPSVLRALSSLMSANSLRKSLFSATPLRDIPPSVLSVAITVPSSGDGINYQRLETLGDAVLKFVVGIQLLAEYPLWHEGYLTEKKDQTIANVRLAKEDLNRRLYRWLIRGMQSVIFLCGPINNVSQ
jgi:hypothetical protein